MSEEVWKIVPGYERYEASSLGRIRNKETGHIMKLGHKKGGYHRLTIQTNDGFPKSMLSHRVIALAFIPNVYGKPDINHKDFNKTNNVPSNLEWCTAHENNEHAMVNGKMTQGKLTKEDIDTICELRNDWKIKDDVLVDVFQVSTDTIRKACEGKLKRLINYGEETNRAKLKNQDVLKIRELSENGTSHTVIGRMFNVTSQNIDRITSRKSWKHI